MAFLNGRQYNDFISRVKINTLIQKHDGSQWTFNPKKNRNQRVYQVYTKDIFVLVTNSTKYLDR